MMAVAAVAGGDLDAHVRAAIGALLAAKATKPRLHHALRTQLGRLDGARLVRSLKARSLELVQAVFVLHQAEICVADPARAAFLVVNAIEGIIDAMLVESPSLLGDATLVDGIVDLVLGYVKAR